MPSPNSGDTPGGGSRAHRDTPRTGEFAAIERIRARLEAYAVPGPGEVWIGDDAAVLGIDGGRRLLLTTDVSVAGVHGDLDVVGLADFGWRALASAISDIAAMGGDVGHAVVAVSGPADTDLDVLYSGIAAASAAHGCPVVGGDLSTSPTLAVAVAVTGSVATAPGPVLRSGARPGHHLFVTRPLGAAAAGLRLLRSGAAGASSSPDAPLIDAFLHPRARLAEGRVARESGVSAMVDVSDGLAADLAHIADASGVGLRLDDVPVAPGASRQDALAGGEDYELVTASADPDGLAGAFAAAGLPAPLRLGVCVADPAERTLRGVPLRQGGWEHPFH